MDKSVVKPKRVFSEEHRKKLSEAHLGQKAWNKGVPMTKEAKEKLSESLKGREGWSAGKKLSEEHKAKLSEAKKGKPGPWLGKKRPHMTGEKHPGWKGGYANVLHGNRRRKAKKKANGGGHILKDWENMKAEYNFTCPCCKQSEPAIKLTTDHIVPISFGGTDNIDNIQPLCISCNARKGNRIVIKYENLGEKAT